LRFEPSHAVGGRGRRQPDLPGEFAGGDARVGGQRREKRAVGRVELRDGGRGKAFRHDRFAFEGESDDSLQFSRGCRESKFLESKSSTLPNGVHDGFE